MKELNQYELSQLRTARKIGEKSLKEAIDTLRDLAIDDEMDEDIEFYIDLLWYLEEYKDIIID